MRRRATQSQQIGAWVAALCDQVDHERQQAIAQHLQRITTLLDGLTHSLAAQPTKPDPGTVRG